MVEAQFKFCSAHTWLHGIKNLAHTKQQGGLKTSLAMQTKREYRTKRNWGEEIPESSTRRCPEPKFSNIWSSGIDSKEWIPPAYVAWRASTITLFLLGSWPPQTAGSSLASATQGPIISPGQAGWIRTGYMRSRMGFMASTIGCRVQVRTPETEPTE
jgi:hypothetical protein